MIRAGIDSVHESQRVAARSLGMPNHQILEEGPLDGIFESSTEPSTRSFLQRVIDAGRL